MNKSELKKIVAEAIVDVRTEMAAPVDPQAKLIEAIRLLNSVASQLKTLVQVCEKNRLPNLAEQTKNTMYEIIKFTQANRQ